MADYLRKPGSASNMFEVFIGDSSVTTGAGKTALAYNTSSLVCYYKRNTASAATAVTLANLSTLGTFLSSGFKEVDATNMPGVYEFHPPDAALAAGAESVTFLFKGATNMRATKIDVDLDAGRPVTGYLRNASALIYFQMVDVSGNGVPGLADGDFTVRHFDADGAGSPSALSGTITEGGPGIGWYYVGLDSSEATFTEAALEFQAPGCIPTKLTLHLNS